VLLAAHIGPVLEQQILGAFKDILVVCGRLAVLTVSDFIDDAAKGGYDMELVKDDMGLWQFFLTALMYGSHMSMTMASIDFRCLAVS
jgi:hypothetical protein